MRVLVSRVPRWVFLWAAGVALIVASFFASLRLTNVALVVIGPFVVIAGVAGVAFLSMYGLSAPPEPRRPVPVPSRPAIRARTEVARPLGRAVIPPAFEARALQGEIVRGPFRELGSGEAR